MDYIELNAENISSICHNIVCKDTYLCSPAYYLMTCRKGGKIHEHQGNYFILSMHPNVDDCILIFNLLKNTCDTNEFRYSEKLAKIILDSNPLIKCVRISRVSEQIANKYKHLLVDEDLLDWKYPVHILDVDNVIKLKGKGYSQVRQRLNHFLSFKCRIKQIEIDKDYDIILSMIKEWIKEFPYIGYSKDDLLLPTNTLLKCMKNKKLMLEGLIVYYDNFPVAYCIWERRSIIANIFAMSADRKIAGLAEYNIVETCKCLKKKGVKKMNIGGSETEGLNRFKKKFNPVESIKLFTCEIKR